MNVIEFFGSEGFGLQVAIITFVVAVADVLLKKFQDRVPPFAANRLPFLIAVIGTETANLITKGAFAFSEETVCSALLSYSVGTIISVSARKLFRGENVGDTLFSLVTGLIENVCAANDDTVLKIVGILKEISDAEVAKQSIVEEMRKDAKDGVDIAELAAVADTILKSAKRFIKEK